MFDAYFYSFYYSVNICLIDPPLIPIGGSIF